ncbi:MAG: glutamate--tRNA ligase [Nitrospirota bacterium]
MSTNTVRVRFAPSPTGHLHIGGVRTALFNWLFARRHKGVFILRIEDTDTSRSTEESIHGIIEGMKWLGLDWNEGPFRQTERLDQYRAHVERLLAQGGAYHCYCSAEELEARRAEALAKKQTPKYDGRCRTRKEPLPGRATAVRLKAPQTGQTVVHDIIRGDVVFENSQLDDLILLRSDGTPTYNLCVVVDDAEMRISHVIRGDDHLNNTPRQLHLYDAFGYEPPQFAHVSMILGPDKARLSKRHGATSALVYREMGYLPEALLNYLARLGWSSGDQEIFSLQEMIDKFSLEQINPSAAVFNPDKLLWLNSHYMKEAAPERLAHLLRDHYLAEREPAARSMPIEQAVKIVTALRERTKTMAEMADFSMCYVEEEINPEPAAAAKFLTPAVKPALADLAQRLAELPVFDEPSQHVAFEAVMAAHQLKMAQLAQPVRVALTGRTVSPGIYDVLQLLGKDRVLSRLKKALDSIGGQTG